MKTTIKETKLSTYTRPQTATERIEARLPVKDVLVIFQTTGVSCDSPIFYEGAKCTTLPTKKTPLFHFSSYGMMPPNHKEFKNVFGFGMCGTAGDTNNVHVVAKAITALNQKQRVGLCQGFVIDKLRDAGYKIEQVDAGFR